MVDYSHWANLEDSDEERERAEKAKADERRAQRAAQSGAARKRVDPPGPKTRDPGGLPALPDGVENLMKAMSCGQYGGSKNKYTLPETAEAKRERARAAEALKDQGNRLYAAGEHFEAAKLYEQAVLKFDWYSDLCADEEERGIVLPVKIPAHLNLAMMSLSLGNHQHAVTHCTEVLRHEPGNAKALFRRGVCYTHLGQLAEAKVDLLRARELCPKDAAIAEALAKLRIKMQEYSNRSKHLSSKMLEGLADEDAEGAQAAAPASAQAEGASHMAATEGVVTSAHVSPADEALVDAALHCADCGPGVGLQPHPRLGHVCSKCHVVVETPAASQSG